MDIDIYTYVHIYWVLRFILLNLYLCPRNDTLSSLDFSWMIMKTIISWAATSIRICSHWSIMGMRWTRAYLHLHGHLPASVVGPAVVVAVAVWVDDAGLTQVPVPGPEGGQVLAAGEPPVGKLRDVGLVRGLGLGGQEQRRRGLSAAVLVMELLLLGPVSGRQMKERILEGKRVAHGGGLLLLLLGQRVGGGAHLAQLAQPEAAGHAGAARASWQPPTGPQLAAQARPQAATASAAQPAEAAHAGDGGLGGVEHVHRLQVRHAVHSGILEVHHRYAFIDTEHLSSQEYERLDAPCCYLYHVQYVRVATDGMGEGGAGCVYREARISECLKVFPRKYR